MCKTPRPSSHAHHAPARVGRGPTSSVGSQQMRSPSSENHCARWCQGTGPPRTQPAASSSHLLASRASVPQTWPGEVLAGLKGSLWLSTSGGRCCSGCSQQCTWSGAYLSSWPRPSADRQVLLSVSEEGRADSSVGWSDPNVGEWTTEGPERSGQNE